MATPQPRADEIAAEEPPNCSPGVPTKASAKGKMLAKLRGDQQQWFDSAEYFLRREGKTIPDAIPGESPILLPPKLSPTSTRSTPPPSRNNSGTRAAMEAAVSDY
ncbi:hypothetical protein FOA52_015319 [Chlamydomonas sp. UWO 241]|nr:hypothetical protein FOA52_015319 [Chlamydomonas sp. UWO 241]